MSHCQKHRLHDVHDLGEVLRWAREHAAGRTAVVYVEAVSDSRPGLLRLHGQDPKLEDPNAAAPGEEQTQAATST